MKNLIFSLVLLMTSIAGAQGLTGTNDLDVWAGTYEVTKCIQCPNHVVESGANLKNLKSFNFGYSHLEKDDVPGCAQMFKTMGISIKFTSDDGKVTHGRSTFWGQCYWGPGKTLDITKQFLNYENTGNPNETSLVRIEKFGDKVKFYLEEYSAKPDFGYPPAFSYEVEAVKID